MNAVPALDLDQIGVRRILDTLADGAYVTDAGRRIVFWNAAATRITGWDREEVLGRPCADNLLVHVDKDGHALCGYEHCPLHRSMVTGDRSQEPILVFAKHKQGHRVPVEVSVAPIRDGEGAVVGGIEVFRDLTQVMEDLRRARVIQDHALQCSWPADARVQFELRHTPAEMVGGDFHRLECLGEGRYAVLVADVMGHGVAAALYTMQLRAMWDDARAWLEVPARFVEELNRRAVRLVNPEGYFATVVFVLIDAASGGVRCVRAGHPAPLLFRPGHGWEPTGGASPAIGLSADAVYREHSLQLEPGDRLLLYTDGALEIDLPDGSQLGLEGLCQILRQVAGGDGGLALEEVERRLLVLSGHLHLDDDLTLLGLYRTRG